METEGSDNEFWNEIEKVEIEEHVNGVQQLSMNLVDLISSKIDQRTVRPPVSSALDKNSREYFEELILRIRESKEEEMKASQIKISNKLKRYYEENLLKIKEKHKCVISEFQKEVTNLKSQLQLRDISINHLCSIISDMESYMINARILNALPKSQSKQQESLIEESLIYQIQVQNTQIATLKETCSAYLEEIDRINKKKSEVKEQFLKKEQGLKKEVEKFQIIAKNKETEFEHKAKKLHNE